MWLYFLGFCCNGGETLKKEMVLSFKAQALRVVVEKGWEARKMCQVVRIRV